ncbi:MAG TPA: carboxypeptidase-like regulatory domain-containing protein [Vicinamibacterales bacterium]|nr:carboxypeptidase-like regulatory domain-containing protein [Vicinamibacterales bacterium]
MMRALMIALVSIAVSTQQPQRDTASTTPVRNGTASVNGIVTLGDEARTPVRRAVVTMLASDGVETRSAVSDDEGRFTIGGLRAGRYTLSALKPAHLTQAYGARRPGRPGTALVIAEGQSMRDVQVILPRGAVLAGRLTTEAGEPLSNTQVVAIPLRLAAAGGAAAAAQDFRTDDRGEYRIYGLAPDSYLVAALPSFGRGGEVQRRSAEELDLVMRKLQERSTPAPGQPAGTRSEAPETVPKTGYAPTYFPGTAVAADATPITAASGDIKDGLSFTVSLVPMATIKGTVIGVDGAPTQAVKLSLEPIAPPMPNSVLRTPRLIHATALSKGEFAITGVSPGRYRLRARAGGVTLRPDGTPAALNLAAQTQWALSDLTITGSDITGVTLVLRPGRTFGGALVAEGAAAPASWKGTMVAIQPNALGGTAFISTRQFSVGDDGRFSVEGIEPNDYEIRVTLPPTVASAGWTIASVRHQGRDLRDAAVTFADGSLEGVEVVLTTAVTELSGRLTSESGTPATDYYVVAFPADRGLWHPASPRVRIMRPAADGLFSTRDLPAGAYRIAALTDVEDDEPRRREFLESIYDAAIPVTVKAGTSTKQDIRIK